MEINTIIYLKKFKSWSISKVGASDLISPKQRLFEWIGAMQEGLKMEMPTQEKSTF